MQYCSKCKKISEDKLTVCPFCKRTRSLRQAKNSDMVFFLKTTEFEAMELEDLFVNNGVACEVRAFKTGIMSSVYDSSVMPTDKEVYVKFENLDFANKLLEQEEECAEEEEEDVPLTAKLVLKHVLMVASFFAGVILLVVSAINIANLF